MEEIIYYLGQLFNFLLVFFIVVVLIFVVFKIALKHSNINEGKIKIYGIFMGLKNSEMLSIGILTIKYAFIIWLIIGVNTENYIYLIILLMLSILYNIINKRFLSIIFDVINSLVIYIAFVCKNTFFEYLNNVKFEWYVLILGIFICLFLFLYANYFFIKDIDFVLKKNKFVKNKISGKKERRNGKSKKVLKHKKG